MPVDVPLPDWVLQVVPASVWVVILVSAFRYYARPNICYVELDSEDPAWTTRFLLKSFDSVPIQGELCLRVEAPLGLQEVRADAGPWFKAFKPLADEAENSREAQERRAQGPKALQIKLDGFPAEGTAYLAIKSAGAGGVRLSIDSCSEIQPRAFQPLPRWRIARSGRVMYRSFLGVLTAAVVFNAFVPIARYFPQHPVRIGLILATLVLAGPILWKLISPFAGKEVIQGYLGGVQAITTRYWIAEAKDATPDTSRNTATIW